eukprot:s30_g13.t1
MNAAVDSIKRNFGVKTTKKVNKDRNEAPNSIVRGKSKESLAASFSQPPEASLGGSRSGSISSRFKEEKSRLAGLLEKSSSKQKKESKQELPPDLFDPEDWGQPFEPGTSVEPKEAKEADQGLKAVQRAGSEAGSETLPEAQDSEEIVVNAIDMEETTEAAPPTAPAVPSLAHFLARSALEDALTVDESLPWRRGRLVLLGQGRAGKTSTVRSLVGKPFDEKQTSTLGVETSSCEIHRSDAVNWNETGHSSETEGLLKQLLTRHAPAPAPVQAPPAPEEKAAKAEGEAMPEHERKRSASSVALASRLPIEEVATRLEQQMTSQSTGQAITFSTWDFGGQSVFHNLHHLFLSRYSVYLVVFKMPHMLKDPHRAVEMIRYWLNSLALHAKGAPILLVGTHKDQVKTSEEHRRISERLLEILGDRLVEQVTPFAKEQEDGLWFYPIDNSLSGAVSPDPVVAELRQAIEVVAKEDPEEYLERPIPIRWRAILDILLEQEASFLTMTEMKRMAAEQCLPAWQLMPMLEMFHELGVLFHFSTPAELREIVILQPQWLVSGMCQVIFDWSLHEQEHHKVIKLEMKSAYDAWREKGMVTRRLLDRLWEFGFEAPHLKAFLLRFMEEVALVCEVDPGNFLVPCLLPPAAAVETAAPQSFVLDFGASFLPDSLFRRLICYAVQKSSRKDRLRLFASHGFLSFEGHDCCIRAKLESDEIQVDLSSQNDTGPWLVLHTITNLVEHLRLDFMKEIRYEVLLCHPQNRQMRVKKEDVENAREKGQAKFRPKGTTRVVQTADFDAFFNAETKPPSILVDSQWRQLKSTWPFLARHEHQFGSAERTALYCYLRDPAHWGISWSALESIENDAKQHFGSTYRDKSMWHVVQEIVKPSCAQTGAPMTLVRNGWEVLPVQDFVTHCWREPFHEFMDSLRHAYDVNVVKPNLFICAFSLFQGDVSDIEQALGQSIPQAPFVKALRSAERYVVVRNRMEDLYTRAWCLVEYIYAKKFGFYKDKVLITGPNDFSASQTTCTQIRASSEEDRLKIFKFIMDEGGPSVIDPQISEFRAFDARFGAPM